MGRFANCRLDVCILVAINDRRFNYMRPLIRSYRLQTATPIDNDSRKSGPESQNRRDRFGLHGCRKVRAPMFRPGVHGVGAEKSGSLVCN